MSSSLGCSQKWAGFLSSSEQSGHGQGKKPLSATDASVVLTLPRGQRRKNPSLPKPPLEAGSVLTYIAVCPFLCRGPSIAPGLFAA
jgi:hypothetical protein